jgi:hypothetical protein
MDLNMDPEIITETFAKPYGIKLSHNIIPHKKN